MFYDHDWNRFVTCVSTLADPKPRIPKGSNDWVLVMYSRHMYVFAEETLQDIEFDSDQRINGSTVSPMNITRVPDSVDHLPPGHIVSSSTDNHEGIVFSSIDNHEDTGNHCDHVGVKGVWGSEFMCEFNIYVVHICIYLDPS